MNAPTPANESRRLAALRSYAILDTASERVFDDVAKLAAYICDVPMATISFVDAERQWFKSRVGVEQQQTSRDIAFCAHTILDSEPMIVGDATQDSRFADSPLVIQEPGIRFYAGFPLLTPEGDAVGSLCAIDRKPRELTDSQKEAMRALSRQVMVLLQLRKVSAELAETLKTVRTLEGLLPVCAWCKKVRNDRGYWSQVEAFLKEHAGVRFTHGICPDCMQTLLPDSPRVDAPTPSPGTPGQ